MKFTATGKYATYQFGMENPWRAYATIKQEFPVVINGIPMYGDLYIDYNNEWKLNYNTTVYRAGQFLKRPTESAYNKLRDDCVKTFRKTINQEILQKVLVESHLRDVNSAREEVAEKESELKDAQEKLQYLETQVPSLNKWTKTRLMYQQNTPLGQATVKDNQVNVWTDHMEYYTLTEFLNELNSM